MRVVYTEGRKKGMDTGQQGKSMMKKGGQKEGEEEYKEMEERGKNRSN